MYIWSEIKTAFFPAATANSSKEVVGKDAEERKGQILETKKVGVK